MTDDEKKDHTKKVRHISDNQYKAMLWIETLFNHYSAGRLLVPVLSKVLKSVAYILGLLLFCWYFIIAKIDMIAHFLMGLFK